MKRKSIFLLIAAIVTPQAYADQTSITPTMVITATRIEQNSFDVPASIDVVNSAQIHDQQLQTNLSESLARVPGITVANRQNYAQDLQVSSRGFGARAPFGVKGIRIIVDDIPATMPDGQGQAATIPLSSTDHIEILRGPFSALYGNGSGGVLQAFTENGQGLPKISNNFAVGSYNTTREDLKLLGKQGSVNYLIDGSWFNTDGYREHSKTERNQVNAKLAWELDESTKLKLSANSYHQNAEDPLGLTLAQLAYNPRMAGGGTPTGDSPKSVLYNSSKTIDYNQAGLVVDKEVNENNNLKLITYYGTRKVQQLQSFETLGVVDLDREFGGINLRYNHIAEIAGQSLKITGGLDYDHLSETRKAYDNISGNVGPDLKRNEDDVVYNLDPYIQANLQLGSKWELTSGLRYNNVHFDIKDNFNAIDTANYNTGKVSYSKATPSVGAIFHVTPTVNLYANAGKGFETPTFAEISYSLDQNNYSVNANKSTLTLKPAESTTYEIGAKAFLADNTRLNAAIFTTQVTNEIAAANNSGGKVAYQNIPETERNGLEISIDSNWGNSLKTYIAYTYLDATVSKNYSKRLTTTTDGVTSTEIQTINSGNKIPGISKSSLYGEAQWSYTPIGFSTAVEANWRSKYYATDLNDSPSLAKSFVAANIRAGFNQKINNWNLSEFIRVNNVFDKNYVGSVIVNESNSRFFEPAPERNWLLGANASYQF